VTSGIKLNKALQEVASSFQAFLADFWGFVKEECRSALSGNTSNEVHRNNFEKFVECFG
jgi:hypothetical protein